MISFSQAESFLVNVLEYKNWKGLYEKDKLEFLRELVPYYAHHIYIQNISMSALPPDERRVPNEDDIIAAGLSGEGGMCITQSAFLAILLKALGFNSYIISGYVRGPGNEPDNHVSCAVEFSSNEKYLLEVGYAVPFAEPIPIHSLPFTRTAAGFRYRYQNANDGRDGVYYRVQLDGALFGGEYEDKSTEYVRYEFTMEPKTVDFFKKPLTEFFTDSIYLQYPFLFRYFEEDQDGNVVDQPKLSGDRKWILIRGVSVLIATDQTRKITHYSTYDQVKDVIIKYFPKLQNMNLEKAYQHFNASVSKHGYVTAAVKTD